jgi:hypothetical protein
VLNVFVNKCPHFDGGKFLHCLVRRSFGGGALYKNKSQMRRSFGGGAQTSKYSTHDVTCDGKRPDLLMLLFTNIDNELYFYSNEFPNHLFY